jgi:hypothetical protein
MAVKKPDKHNFKTVTAAEVPTGRNGKHKAIVVEILENLDTLKQGNALKVRLSELPDTKVNIRSALNRATRKMKIKVATAADSEFLYIWNGAAE